MTRAMTMLLAFVFSLVAQAADVERTLRDLEQAQTRAAIARDRSTLEKLFTPDFTLVNPTGAITDRTELLALLTGTGPSPYRSADYRTEKVTVLGNTALTIGLETVVPDQGAQAGQTVQRRITHVWVREGSGWRLRHRHATLVQ